MKPLYALVFVLSTCAAPAQALDAATMAACEFGECSLDVIELSTMPAPTVAGEPTIATVRDADDEADDVVITGANGAEDILVGSTQGGGETQARPARMVAGDPTIDELAEAVDAAGRIAHGRAPPPRD